MAGAIPEGFTLVREIGPFTAATLPGGLRAEHRLKPGRWGHLTLSAGAVRLVMDDGSGAVEHLIAPATTLVPPEIPHHLEFDGDFRLGIAFLARAEPSFPA